MDTASLALIVAVWFVGGFLNGLCGLGAGLVALPLLSGIMTVRELAAHGALVPVGLAIAMFVKYRRFCRYGSTVWLTIGSVPGMLFGLLLLTRMPNSVLLLLMGFFLLAYTLWHCLGKKARTPHPETRPAALLAGFLSGTTQGMAAFGGPPASIYALHVGWELSTAIGTLSGYFLYLMAITCVMQGAVGLLTMRALEPALYGSIGCLGGFFASSFVVPYVNLRLFQKILLAIIAYAGLLCIFRACNA